MESGKPGESPGMIQRNLANFPYPSPSVAMTYFLFRTNFWFLLSQFTVNARMVQTLCVCVCVCVCVCRVRLWGYGKDDCDCAVL